MRTTTLWNSASGRLAVRVFALALVLASTACGDDDSDSSENGGSGGSSGQPCVQGTSWSCFGAGNCQGIQLCTGGRLGPCMCRPTAMEDGGQPRDGAITDSGEPVRDGAAPAEDAATTPDAAADASTQAEDCDNDTDDDGDGDADCADDDCSARTCVGAPPTGWNGPVVLQEGDDAPAACSAGYPTEAERGGTTVTAAPATCSACSCTPPTPGCAGFLNFETSLSNTCGAAPAGTCTFPVNSSCSELSSPCLTQATGYVQALLPGGLASCAPSPQQPSVTAADWDRHALVCEADHDLVRAGCAEGDVCAPAQPADGELCIYHYFDVPCPAGPYTDRRLYGTHIADTRACSDCQCAQDCTYGWRVFDAADTTCTGSSVALEENQCVAVTPGSPGASGGRVRVGTTVAGTGACTQSGGTPTGGAQAQNPITVCCLP